MPSCGQSRPRVIRFFCFAPIVALTLAACELFADLAPLPERCPQVQAVETPTVVANQRLFFVLVAGTDQYEAYRHQAATILSNVFTEVLGPGDQVMAAWMEVEGRTTDDIIFFNTPVATVPLPSLDLEPTAVLIPTYTPEPTPETSLAQRAYQDCIQEIEATNEAIPTAHYCQTLMPLRLTQQAQIDQYEQRQQQEIDIVVNSIQEAILGSTENRVSVFEALEITSDIFAQVCASDSDRDCMLFIFSNMQEWRSETPPDVAIDFSHNRVAIVLLDCMFFIHECETRVETWRNHFSNYNPQSTCFFNQQNTVPLLIDYVEEQQCNN